MGHEIPYRFIRNADSDPQNRHRFGCAAMYLYSAALGVVVGLMDGIEATWRRSRVSRG